jgi:hypothetical protein
MRFSDSDEDRRTVEKLRKNLHRIVEESTQRKNKKKPKDTIKEEFELKGIFLCYLLSHHPSVIIHPLCWLLTSSFITFFLV